MRTPIAVIITDTHSDKDSWNDTELLYDQAMSLCDELGTNNLFMLGDAFTSRTAQALRVLGSFKSIVKRAQKRGIDIHAIAGNHDKTDQESEESYLDMYEDYDNFHLYKAGTSVSLSGITCHFLPYFPEGGSYLGRLQELVKNAKKIGGINVLLTHVAVDGVVNNDGTGVSNRLKAIFFKHFTKVMVGHYHNRSKVGSNIFYIGSDRQRNYGEDDDKGFTVLYSDGSHEYVNSKFQRYIKRGVDLTQLDVDDVYTIAEQMAAEKAKSGDKMRLVLTGTDEDFAALDMARLKRLGLDIKQENLHILRSMEAAKSAPTIHVSKDDLFKKFIKYCGVNKVTPSLRKLGMKYVKEA